MTPRIPLDPKTRDRLRTFGHAGMSYDEIIRALMDATDRDRFLRDLQRKAEGERDWVELDAFDWGE